MDSYDLQHSCPFFIKHENRRNHMTKEQQILLKEAASNIQQFCKVVCNDCNDCELITICDRLPLKLDNVLNLICNNAVIDKT